jgi:hypothetical protein
VGIERSDASEETAPPERPEPHPVEQTDAPRKSETSRPAETDQVYEGPFDSRDAEFAARHASREYAAVNSEGSTQDGSADEPATVQTLEEPPWQEERLSEPARDDSGSVLDQQIDRQTAEPAAVGEENEQAQEQAIASDPGESLPASEPEVRDDEPAAETSDPVTDHGRLEFDEQGQADTAENREWVPLPGEEHIPVTRLEMRARPAELETGIEQSEQDDPWRQHVEQMQAAWEDHEARWPADAPGEGDGPGAPGEGGQDDVADSSGDEPGSWRGDGGQYLNAEENYSVTGALDRMRGEEPNVTSRLRDHESEVDGADLVGLEYRLKGEDRYKEKAAEKLAAELRRSPSEAAESIADGIRYTYQIPADRYTQSYQEITGRLKEDGNQMVLSKNSWDDPEYKGINTRWRTPEGQIFEV